MRLVLISDTHNQHLALPPLPSGHAIIHAGDITGSGTLDEIRSFFDWFGTLPYRHKIVIAGNHDFAFERQAPEAEALVPAGVTYLRDQGTSIGPLKLWGSPWQPWFGNLAFNLRRGAAMAERSTHAPSACIRAHSRSVRGADRGRLPVRQRLDL